MLKFTSESPEVQRLIDACYNRELTMTTADTRQFISTFLNRIAQNAVEASRPRMIERKLLDKYRKIGKVR